MKAENTAIIFLLISCLLSLVSAARADIIGHNGIPAAYQPYIVFPLNSVYHSNSLTLNVSFHAGVWANIQFTMVNSLDGQENKSLPLVAHDYNFFENDLDYFDGAVILPDLTDGLHNLTVYLECNWEFRNKTTSWHEYYYDSQTVYFTIDANALSTPSPTPTTSLSPNVTPLSSSTPQPTINTGSEPPKTEPFLTQTVIVAVLVVLTVMVVAGLLFYHKHKAKAA